MDMIYGYLCVLIPRRASRYAKFPFVVLRGWIGLDGWMILREIVALAERVDGTLADFGVTFVFGWIGLGRKYMGTWVHGYIGRDLEGYLEGRHIYTQRWTVGAVVQCDL